MRLQSRREAFVAQLPGRFLSADDFFCAFNWNRLGYGNNPCSERDVDLYDSWCCFCGRLGKTEKGDQ